MPRKSNYPDWVTKHIKKGWYINKVKDKYYVYQAHSERREGCKNPVRVCDAYLGRITQNEGFVPSKKSKIASPLTKFVPTVLDFGIPISIVHCSQNIYKGIQKVYKERGDLIYICSVLSFSYGTYSEELYKNSVLSLLFPNCVFPKVFDDSYKEGLTRGKRMITDTVSNFYKNKWNQVKPYLSTIVLIKSTRGFKLPNFTPTIQTFIETYDVPLNLEFLNKFLDLFNNFN